MAERPNFLLIMSDQHNRRVLGCAGDPVVRTPHLDALAAGGVRFSRAYCGSPLCVPSRMTFLTGQHCSDIDVYGNSCQLASDIPTFAHGLGAAGYEVVLGGRMHFLGPDQRHGFHRRLIGDLGPSEWGGPGVDLGPIPPRSNGQSRPAVATSGPGLCCYQVYDEHVVPACQEYLRTRQPEAEKPFCLVAGLLLPHCPFVTPQALYDYYLERVSLPDIPDDYWAGEPEVIRQLRAHRELVDVTVEETRSARAAYYGMVEVLDRLIGQLLATLAEQGLAENTIVIYCSDHGEAAGENGLWCKTTFYEGSVGVPLLVRGPGVPAGVTCDLNASLLDLGPTMLDYAGGLVLPGAAGRSLRPLIEQRVPAGWDDTVRAEMIPGGVAPPDGCMVKQGPWKLMHYEGHEPLLFNLDDDPEERTNLAAAPGLRWLRDQLHQRSLQGWDPRRSRGVMARKGRYHGLLAQWRRNFDKPDPDHWDAPPGANVWLKGQ